MKVQVTRFTLHKRHALRISRGTTAASANLWLRLSHGGIEGWGEASSFATGGRQQDADRLQQQIEAIAPQLASYSPWDRQQIEQLLVSAHVPSGVRTAIDLALHDWMGKQLGLPLWKLWGLDLARIPPVSVTIGISSPEAAQARLRAWQETVAAEVIKIKLGSPEGIAADQAMFSAVEAIAPPGPAFTSMPMAAGTWPMPLR
jgi:L-Ala-D/L-Glu epimerase